MAVQTLPVNIDLTVYTGTSFRREFHWRPNGGAGQDFTGWAASFRIGPQHGTPAYTFTSGHGVTFGADGQFIVLLTPSQTIAMSPGTYFYVLDLTDPTGFILRILRGRLSVVRDLEI